MFFSPPTSLDDVLRYGTARRGVAEVKKSKAGWKLALRTTSLRRLRVIAKYLCRAQHAAPLQNQGRVWIIVLITQI
jgi:hypothetical protein